MDHLTFVVPFYVNCTFSASAFLPHEVCTRRAADVRFEEVPRATPDVAFCRRPGSILFGMDAEWHSFSECDPTKYVTNTFVLISLTRL